MNETYTDRSDRYYKNPESGNIIGVWLTDDEWSETGEGWYFAILEPRGNDAYREIDGGIYWDYPTANDLVEAEFAAIAHLEELTEDAFQTAYDECE